MSSVPPDAAPPQQPSIVGDLQFARPTLVRVLVASMYLPALTCLGMVAATMAGSNQPLSGAVPLVLSGLVMALIAFVLGKGIARGSHAIWVVTLILAAISVVQSLPALLLLPWFAEEGAGLVAIVVWGVVTPVVVLALILTPTVRGHCVR